MRAIAASMILFALCGRAPLNSDYWLERGPGESRVISRDAYQGHLIVTEDVDGQADARRRYVPLTDAGLARMPAYFAEYRGDLVEELELAEG